MSFTAGIVHLYRESGKHFPMIIDVGMEDTYRAIHPQKQAYTIYGHYNLLVCVRFSLALKEGHLFFPMLLQNHHPPY